MKHIILMDPLEKLVVKKDSTILLALSLKNCGEHVELLFLEDLFLVNTGLPQLKTFDFNGELKSDCFEIESFSLMDSKKSQVEVNDCIHFRLDPPFDSNYLKCLWVLRNFEEMGVRVLNSASGILSDNEKLLAYREKDKSHPTYVGNSLEGFNKFVDDLKSQGVDQLILKPLDLFQGIGVQKVDLSKQSNLDELFMSSLKQYKGQLVAQPFDHSVKEGEIRAIYYGGDELGSIIKVPKEGEFLANIAQGASYSAVELEPDIKELCDGIAKRLLKISVPWLAFDILGGKVSEVNITCPGLLVEVSNAHQKNLALMIKERL